MKILDVSQWLEVSVEREVHQLRTHRTNFQTQFPRKRSRVQKMLFYTFDLFYHENSCPHIAHDPVKYLQSKKYQYSDSAIFTRK